MEKVRLLPYAEDNVMKESGVDIPLATLVSELGEKAVTRALDKGCLIVYKGMRYFLDEPL